MKSYIFSKRKWLDNLRVKPKQPYYIPDWVHLCNGKEVIFNGSNLLGLCLVEGHPHPFTVHKVDCIEIESEV